MNVGRMVLESWVVEATMASVQMWSCRVLYFVFHRVSNSDHERWALSFFIKYP